jgi:UDP-N-acetylglucosamine--N-acetylmuramyl-(pentapeptide) pyrophosphoryl-undecaprenol N-acetylglucosamine transferase
MLKKYHHNTELKKETFMKKLQTVCYIAGKSGGHIIPCLTLAHEKKMEHPETRILFFSTNEPLDKEIVSASPDVTTHITLPLQNISPKSILHIPIIAWNMLISIAKLLYYFITQRPDKVICTGGFIAIPATLCARLLAIPVELFELNAKPGRAIQFLSSWSVTIRICFTQTLRYLPRKKCIKTAYPIRFFDTRKQMCQKEALQELHLDPSRKTITILGGSQGSLEINKLIYQCITAHPEIHETLQVIHQIGHNDTYNWQEFYKKYAIPAHVFSFYQDLAPHYAAADLVICRAGAGTLFEILFFGKSCITIPLITKKNTHQLTNALTMQEEYSELFHTFIPAENSSDDLLRKILDILNTQQHASFHYTNENQHALD